MATPRISIVVALGKNREVGKGGQLLWHIPDDMRRFKALTLGHPVIMGRKTFESILASLGKPLPGRTNIVITRDAALAISLGDSPLDLRDTIIVHSLEEALDEARKIETEEIHIGGGAQLYEQVLPLVDRLYLTLIDDTKDADTYFPPYEHLFIKTLSDESHDYNGLKYRWLTVEK